MREMAHLAETAEARLQFDEEREQLILKHLPQIRYIAQRISTKLPSHVELNDLVSAGVLGLLDAIEKFDPNRGVRFKTYAELRIKGAILDSLRNLDWAPRALRKKSKNLEKAYRNLEQQLGRPASDKEVSDEMGIPLEEFYELVSRIKGLNPSSFQELASQEDDRNVEPPTTHIAVVSQTDPFRLFEKSECQSILARAIDRLPKKERLVVSLYYYEDLSMKEIGKVLGVNESRVSQLHTNAMIRMCTRSSPTFAGRRALRP
jgi:RNA polymerase sigma factor FliA